MEEGDSKKSNRKMHLFTFLYSGSLLLFFSDFLLPPSTQPFNYGFLYFKIKWNFPKFWDGAILLASGITLPPSSFRSAHSNFVL